MTITIETADVFWSASACTNCMHGIPGHRGIVWESEIEPGLWGYATTAGLFYDIRRDLAPAG